jgi:hypothetical protein
MNPDTGKVYTGPDVQRAIDRGERLVPISEKAAKLLGIGRAKRVQQLRRRRRLMKRTR